MTTQEVSEMTNGKSKLSERLIYQIYIKNCEQLIHCSCYQDLKAPLYLFTVYHPHMTQLLCLQQLVRVAPVLPVPA